MSLYQVKVQTSEVLKIVKENKEKHDIIFNDAVDGYWADAVDFLKKYEKETIAAHEKTHRDQLKLMRKNLKTTKAAIKEQVKKELALVNEKNKVGYKYMRNVFPENHTDDYAGTIRRLELSVDKEIELDTNEFDSYIRNKWAWRDSFLTSNTGYVNSKSARSGIVGLGNTNPSYKLDVMGNVYNHPSYCGTGSWVSGSVSSSYALNSF